MSAPLLIREDTLRYRAATLTLGSDLAAWKVVLGQPSRFVDRAGGAYVWDELGLVAFMQYHAPANDPHVRELWICLTPGTSDLWPRRPFASSISVVQLPPTPGSPTVTIAVDAETTLDALRRQGFSFDQDPFPSLSGFARILQRADQDERPRAVAVGLDPTGPRS